MGRATPRNPSVRGRKRAWTTSEEPSALILRPSPRGVSRWTKKARPPRDSPAPIKLHRYGALTTHVRVCVQCSRVCPCTPSPVGHREGNVVVIAPLGRDLGPNSSPKC